LPRPRPHLPRLSRTFSGCLHVPCAVAAPKCRSTVHSLPTHCRSTVHSLP
jgi:hypothetical protein